MKRVLISIFLSLIILALFVGCNNNQSTSNDISQKSKSSASSTTTEKTNDTDNNIINETAGDVSEEINTVTEVEYDDLFPHLNDRIVVQKDGKYGIIDNQGKVVMPIEQDHNMIPAGKGAAIFYENDKCGVLSMDGSILLTAIYDRIKILNDDLLCVTAIDGESLGYVTNATSRIYSISKKSFIGDAAHGINLKAFANDEVVFLSWTNYSDDPMFHNVMYDLDGNVLSTETDSDFCFYVCDDKKYIIFHKKILDTQGNTLFDLSDSLGTFFCGTVGATYYDDTVLIKQHDSNYNEHHFSSLNIKTGELTELDFLDPKIGITGRKTNGFYVTNLYDLDNHKGYYGLLNERFETVVEPVYDLIDDYANGYFSVCSNNKYGYVDIYGNVTEPVIDNGDLETFDKFAFGTANDGALINPKNAEPLPYKKAHSISVNGYYPFNIYHLGIYEATLLYEQQNNRYKSFVTWDGPITDHKFPNTDIRVSDDGKVATYKKDGKFVIVELL